MAEARQRDQWNHTASLIAWLVNVNRDPKKRPVSPEMFHPYTAKAKAKPIKGNIRMLKEVFVDRRIKQ